MTSYSYYSYYTDYTTGYDYSSTYSTTPGFTGDAECMNYIYLVWVYFLFYVGAGYPTWYYPYLIATLLDSVPEQCGGTGDDDGSGGPGLDSSLLTALNLQQPGGGVSIGGFNGYSPGGYGSSAYVVQQPAPAVSSGGLSGDLASYGIQQPQVVMPNNALETGRRKRSAKIRKPKSRRKGKIRKTKKIDKKKKKRSKSKKDKERNIRRKQITRIEKNKVKRKGTRKEDRKKDRQAKKKTERKKERKIKKSKKRKSKKKERKTLRKNKRKGKRRHIRKARKSRLGKSIPTKQLKMAKQYFAKGKHKTDGKLTILKGMEFPYNKKGKLKRGFRRLVKSKLIERLPDYCEQAKLSSSSTKDNKKKDCNRRAERIKQRVRERIKM